MTDSEETNLPNVLAYITGGMRFDFDIVQCALGVTPRQVPAGQGFEALLLVQSAFDCKVDVRVRVYFPAKDVKGEKGRFFTKSDRILLGMEPAEVGVVKLPISCSPFTAQAVDYRLGVEVKVEKVERGERVRTREGGSEFDPEDITDEQTLARLEALRAVTYSATADRQRRLIASFDVVAPAGPNLALNLSPAWESLWTMRDYVDERIVVEKAGAQAGQVLPLLKRDRVLVPLMKTLQSSFERAGYPLHAGEALFAAKLLTLVLENGVSTLPDVPLPRWYVRLCRLLFANENAANNLEHLVTRLLWPDLIVDATVLGFNMVGTVTRQQLARDDEAEAYAQDLARRLSTEGASMDFMRAYLPLVMGGLVANTRIVMEREQVLDSVHLIEQARRQRQAEMTAQNRDVFDLTDLLINRALDAF